MVAPLIAPKQKVCVGCGREFVPKGRNASRQICCEIKCWQRRYNKIKDIPGKLRKIRAKQRELKNG
jgi:hypothetical protein